MIPCTTIASSIRIKTKALTFFRDAVARDIRPGDTDVHGAEEQQETEGAVRTKSASQVRYSSPANHGSYQVLAIAD